MNAELQAVIKDVNASLPERKLIALIERTNLSADAKALMIDMARITVKVGGKILAIGRKLLSFVFDLIKAFPTITIGTITALVLTSMIAGIPIFGGALAAALGSLLLILGIGAGVLNDFTILRFLRKPNLMA
jgi:hypothetical protein